jgi:hypothetical protein
VIASQWGRGRRARRPPWEKGQWGPRPRTTPKRTWPRCCHGKSICLFNSRDSMQRSTPARCAPTSWLSPLAATPQCSCGGCTARAAVHHLLYSARYAGTSAEVHGPQWLGSQHALHAVCSTTSRGPCASPLTASYPPQRPVARELWGALCRSLLSRPTPRARTIPTPRAAPIGAVHLLGQRSERGR